MKIGYVEKVVLLIINPAFFGKCLTLGTVTVATGVVRRPGVATSGTDVKMTTQPGRPAIGDSAHHLALFWREGVAATVLAAVVFKDLLDFRHERLSAHAVQRAFNMHLTDLDQVQIETGGADIGVTQQLLDVEEVHAVLQQVSGKGVAERMRCDLLGDSCRSSGFMKDIQRSALCQVGSGFVTADDCEKPASWPALFPVSPEQNQAGVGENGEPVFTALAIADQELHVSAVDVLDF